MTDVLDRASELEIQLREANIKNAVGPLAIEGSDDCTSCGEEIDLARKNAMPSARLCLSCREKFEKRNRGMI